MSVGPLLPGRSSRDQPGRGHVALVDPRGTEMVMDALAEGWLTVRRWKNLHFTKWEQQLDRPLDDIRDEYGAPPVVRAPAGRHCGG